MDDSLDERSYQGLRQHWTDALAAFGARIEVDVLPESNEHRSRSDWLGASEALDMDRPVRIRVVGREYVTGPVLVEIDEQRDRIAAAFRELANGGG